MAEKNYLLLLQSVRRKLLERSSDITKYKRLFQSLWGISKFKDCQEFTAECNNRGLFRGENLILI